jgi:hypothetical protein
MLFWPLLFLCRPFCIERCLDANPESWRSKQARYQYSQPSPKLATPSPNLATHLTLSQQSLDISWKILVGTQDMVVACL